VSLLGRLPGPVRGAFWMTVSAAAYTIAAASVRELDGRYSVFQLTFIRAVIAIPLLTPMVLRGGGPGFRTTRPFMHLLCAALTYGAMLLWTFGAGNVPVADFFALQFTTPLFTIALAAILLRERVDMIAWLAALFGFAGVLVVLRPGVIDVTVGALATIACSAMYAGVNTTVRVLSRTEAPTLIVLYVNLLTLPLSCVPAIIAWRTPTAADWVWVLGAAVFSTIGIMGITRGIASAAARIVQPVSFLRLPFAAGLGFVMFAELPDLWTWVGATMIFAATWFVLQRETRGKT
jgi:drug/metabolite transporter (DMT)-like permease